MQLDGPTDGLRLDLAVADPLRPPAAGSASWDVLRYASQRDLVRASLLLVGERPKTPAV
jgi:hypothetical protein